MRLPERLATRRNYAVAAFMAGCLPATVLAFLVGSYFGPTLLIPLLVAALILPPALAWWVWPKTRRTAFDMVWRGAAIVLLSIFLGGMIYGVLYHIHHAGQADWRNVLFAPFFMGAIGLFFGSMVTLGLPWLLGIGVSWLFRDPPS